MTLCSPSTVVLFDAVLILLFVTVKCSLQQLSAIPGSGDKTLILTGKSKKSCLDPSQHFASLLLFYLSPLPLTLCFCVFLLFCLLLSLQCIPVDCPCSHQKLIMMHVSQLLLSSYISQSHIKPDFCFFVCSGGELPWRPALRCGRPHFLGVHSQCSVVGRAAGNHIRGRT